MFGTDPAAWLGVGGTQKRLREDAGASEEEGRREGVSWAMLPGVAAGEKPSPRLTLESHDVRNGSGSVARRGRDAEEAA